MMDAIISLSELDQLIVEGQSRSDYFAEALVSHYYPYVHRLALTLLSHPSDADDLCQETFITALLHIDRYAPGTDLKAWLSQIAVRKSRHFLRRRRLRDTQNGVPHTRHRIELVTAAPNDEVVNKEEAQMIWASINALEEKHRVPVILYYVFDFKLREIAAILQIPEGTVSSRLHYAIRRLGKQLKMSEPSFESLS